MRHCLLAAALLCAPAFSATMIAKEGDSYVRLSDKPCNVASVLRFLKEDARAEFKRADTRVGGQNYFACYIRKDELVFLIDEDGDTFAFPWAAFSEEIGI